MHPVSHEVIEKIVEASAYAPSWKNSQTARYIIIEETALKDRIAREAVIGFEWTKRNHTNIAGRTILRKGPF